MFSVILIYEFNKKVLTKGKKQGSVFSKKVARTFYK